MIINWLTNESPKSKKQNFFVLTAGYFLPKHQRLFILLVLLVVLFERRILEARLHFWVQIASKIVPKLIEHLAII